jgi:Rieske Fe-S protein
MPGPTRRALLATTGLVGTAGLAGLCGCAVYGPPSAPRTDSTPPGGPPSEGAAPAGQPAAVLARTSDVPVGGGTVLADRGIVLTQPEAGRFLDFDATCTHQGCTVTDVADGTIDCPCHGSRFRIADGSVAEGPATRALAPRRITVTGGAITQA